MHSKKSSLSTKFSQSEQTIVKHQCSGGLSSAAEEFVSIDYLYYIGILYCTCCIFLAIYADVGYNIHIHREWRGGEKQASVV